MDNMRHPQPPSTDPPGIIDVAAHLPWMREVCRRWLVMDAVAKLEEGIQIDESLQDSLALLRELGVFNPKPLPGLPKRLQRWRPV